MMNLAFHDDPLLAAKVRKQIADHTAADEIIQGKYWEGGKGCFIGCIAHGPDLSTVEQMTGFPNNLIRIAENIFEDLPNEVAKDFPQRVIGAPQVGADLSLVSWKFLHWLVNDALTECADDETRAVCTPALDILAARSRGEGIYSCAARDTAAAACDTAAAHAAAVAAAARDTAAVAAAYAAAAYSATYTDGSALFLAARVRQADKLVELLGAATKGTDA